ncbi:ERMES complex subunit mmm1 [Phlyctochytrium planicorne]|nr:ERMES complex subunit mmm1 [Phlyctochytrium planicorne]
MLDDLLNGTTRPSFLGPITITDFTLGDEYPILKSARMRFAEHSSNLRAEISFIFDDQITIGIDTQVLINWPKPLIASLPVSLALSVIKFSGTLALEFVTHPETAETYMAVSILEDFCLEFEVRSLLGHRTKVKDLPKLTALITSRLRSVFMDEIVWPSFKRIHIPTTFSSKRPAEASDPDGMDSGSQNPIGQGSEGSLGMLRKEDDDDLQVGDSASVLGVSGERKSVNGPLVGDGLLGSLSDTPTLIPGSSGVGLERRRSRPPQTIQT